ncbi:MAG TPA: hypothetical protein DCE41_05885 [Cytophagales bacterium]|nr:hypothetical protein [Cytophagales bacterium]HAA22209.1 hypothetical protein [Cytophagales bacterium]
MVMIRYSLLLVFVAFSFTSLSQTNLSGTIFSSTTLTQEGSPYTLTANVGIVDSAVLTIEPGVEIRGNFDFVVEGGIDIVGTESDSIIMHDTRLRFGKADLSKSSIAYTKFTGSSGMTWGDRATFAFNPINNLTISHCNFQPGFTAISPGYWITNTFHFKDCKMDGVLMKSHRRINPYTYDNRVEYLIDHCEIQNSQIIADRYLPIIQIQYSELKNCELSLEGSAAYGPGDMFIIKSKLTETTFKRELYGSLFHIEECFLVDPVFTGFKGFMVLKDSRIIASPSLEVYNNALLYSPGQTTVDNCIFEAPGADFSAIRVNANPYEPSITNSTFIGFKNVVEFQNVVYGSVTQCNFFDYDGYAFINNDPTEIIATGNYWDVDSNTIPEVIYDLFDDIESGRVDYSGFRSAPTSQLPISAPQIIGKGYRNGMGILQWNPADHAYVAGYRIYQKDREEYTLVGETDSETLEFSIPASLFNQEYVVTAIKEGADGFEDYWQGNESEKSEAAPLFFSTSLVASQYCAGDALEFEIENSVLASEETYQVQIATQQDFLDARSLGKLDPTSQSATLVLPDTLVTDSVYYLRIVAESADVYMTVHELTYRARPLADFSVPEALCEGSLAPVQYSDAGANAIYFWNWDGGGANRSDDRTYEVFWESPGTKEITLVTEIDGCRSDTVRGTIDYRAYPELSFDAATEVCFGQPFVIEYVGTSYDSLVWDFGEITPESGEGPGPYTIQFDGSGTRTLDFGAYNGGCYVDTTFSLVISEEPAVPGICSITLDPTLERNVLTWTYDKPSVIEFGVYRAISAESDFELLEYIQPGNSLFYVDETGDPNSVQIQYKLTAVDTCGYETELSEPHGANHLAINQTGDNTWDLNWSGYEGAGVSNYLVYRSLFRGDFELLTELDSNTFTLSDGDVPTVIVQYQIAAVLSDVCNEETGDTPSIIWSNIARSDAVTGLDVEPLPIRAFPNPAQNFVTLELAEPGPYHYRLLSPLGQEVRKGNFSETLQLDLSGLPAGLYTCEVLGGNQARVFTLNKL